LLNLTGYEIFRQDRGNTNEDNAYNVGRILDSGRRGGGIFVAFLHENPRLKFKRSPAEDFGDNIMNFEMAYSFNCRRCKEKSGSGKFGFTVVYRRPGPYKDQSILLDLLKKFIALNGKLSN